MPESNVELARRGFAVLTRLVREGAATRESYRAAASGLGSRESWTRLYGQPTGNPDRVA